MLDYLSSPETSPRMSETFGTSSVETSPRLTSADEKYSHHVRSSSTSSMGSVDSDSHIPFDRLTVLDLLDPLAMGTHITKKLNTTVRKRGTEIKSMALRQRDRVLKGREDDIERLRVSVLKRVGVLEQRLSSARVVSTTEKLAFSLSLLNVFFAGYLIGRCPKYFHTFYTVELALLLPIRLYTYRKKDYHYFLADLCYFVNALCMLYIWVLPGSAPLFVSCYALSFGTLSWAVITWRNSLVLHSIEKTTSSFIHILPPAVFHVITHGLDPEYKSARFPGSVVHERWRVVHGIGWASLTYLVWQSLYHYFITVKRKDKIKAGLRSTSFEHLRRSYGRAPIGKFVNSLPEPFPVVAFTLIQYGYQVATMSLCPLFYSNEWLSALFVTFIFFWASLNGATYYIDIFGKRFQKELIKLQAEVEQWKAAGQMVDPDHTPAEPASSETLQTEPDHHEDEPNRGQPKSDDAVQPETPKSSEPKDADH